MTLYLGRNGGQYETASRLGGGGEAEIFTVTSHPNLVAKIYSATKTGYSHKLEYMVANPPTEPQVNHRMVAWPMDVLYDANGFCLGYLMPRIIGAVPILDVMTPKNRAKALPGFDQRYLYRTAQNLATAFQTVHNRGYVIGDVNESNAMVTNTALVTLIDTDSFQVQDFLCPVGKPEFTPPELNGKDIQIYKRTEKQDLFGLGVLIFMLLMNGKHPFSGRWTGPGDLFLTTKIQNGWFPYFKVHPSLIPPPKTTLSNLDPSIVSLIKRCFVDGHQDPSLRPTAAEWADTLNQVQLRQFAYERFITAVQSDDDDKIVDSYQVVLENDSRITFKQRERLKLARQRQSAYRAFQPALVSNDEQLIAKHYASSAMLLESYRGMSNEERDRATMALACVNMPKNVRAAIHMDDDEVIFKSYNSKLERPFTGFNIRERERINLALQRWPIYQQFKQALTTNDDTTIASMYHEMLNGYRYCTAADRQRLSVATDRLNSLDHLRTALLARDNKSILQWSKHLPSDYPYLLQSERKRITQARHQQEILQRMEQAIASDDDVAILHEYDSAQDTLPLLLNQTQQQRVALALQRAEALRIFRVALTSGSDEQIASHYSVLLDQDQRVTPQELIRLDQARKRVATLIKFRKALASENDDLIVKSYRRTLNECIDVQPSERARYAVAIMRLKQRDTFLRALMTDDDELIVTAFSPELRTDSKLTSQQRNRYELAISRLRAVYDFLAAIRSGDDAQIVSAFNPLVTKSTKVSDTELQRYQQAQDIISAIRCFRQAFAQDGDIATILLANGQDITGRGLLTLTEETIAVECDRYTNAMKALHAALIHGTDSDIIKAYSMSLLNQSLSLAELKRLSLVINDAKHRPISDAQRHETQ